MHEVLGDITLIMLSGFFMVFFAGIYTLLYGFSKISKIKKFEKISYIFAVLQFIFAVFMVLPDFLSFFWKSIVIFSAVVYLFVPQGMWWFVSRFHNRWEGS